ncbi:LLM class flavin-dependent oxidoreductase [Streptomyces sp. NBC_00390]|uniref:LLM class flavin-dependent oxidoreductase n=1 Tax=Streptomyces sp. NBC_00390 TaxID=2975736 RepID=UPI002E1D774D
MSDLNFGFSLMPTTDIAHHLELVATAEDGGLDLVGIQDHPYMPALTDTFTLIGHLIAHTEHLTYFPDVASLPLRPPAMLAKTSAALDLVSGGRFELALGAGGYWESIEEMGVARRTPRQGIEAVEEAVHILRALWSPGRPVRFEGRYYRLDGVQAGPAPAHPIGIWLGAQGPRALAQTGRIADGWAAPIPSYLQYEKWAEANARIDTAAREAGRKPDDIMRMAQIVGTITDRPADAEARTGAAPVRGTPDQWARLIARLATEQPFRTFVFWPERSTTEQIHRFAHDVVPVARALLAKPWTMGQEAR